MVYNSIPEISKKILCDRQQAGYLLAERLSHFKHSDAVVVAIPNGGVPVAYAIATTLNLSLDILPCKKILHPAHRNSTIGSVSLNDVVLSDNPSVRDVPTDYIRHQLALIRSILKKQLEAYKENNPEISFSGHPVILVDDRLHSGDTMLAGILSIRRKTSEPIVIAVPISSHQAAQRLRPEVSEFITLVTHDDDEPTEHFFDCFTRVEDHEVKSILSRL